MSDSGQSTSRHHVVSHAAVYLLARGVPGLIAFLAIPVFTRLLHQGEYGRYALVVTTASMLNALLFQGLRQSLVRYLPAYAGEPAKLKSTLLAASGVVAIALALVAAVMYVLPWTASWRSVLLPCWGLTVAQAGFELTCDHARAVLQPRRYMVMQVTKSLASLAIGAGLVVIGLRWSGPLAGLAAGLVLPVLWAARRDWGDVRLALADRVILKRILAYGVPLSLTVALTGVITTCDRFLIAGMLSEGAAGLYSAAVDFTTNTLTMLLMVVYMAAFPLAVRAFEHQGPAAAREQMRTNASLLMAIGLPCTIGLIVLAPNLAHAVMGAEYRQTAARIMPLVAVGALLAGLKACHFDTAFQFAHRTIEQVWIVLFAAALNVGLNVAMIPRMGINGAALASVIAFAASIGVTAWLGRRHFALPFPVRPAMQVVVAGAVMAAALWPTRGRLGVALLAGQVIGGGAIYAAALVAMNFMGVREQVVRRVRARRALDLSVAEVAV